MNKIKRNQKQSRDAISSPFSRDYWRSAVSELSNLNMITIAAIVVAVRVSLHQFSLALEIAPNLKINLSFWISAAGSMIYGPLVGLLSGAVSDTLSCILFPSGPYFFPFVFVEMLGCFIFALFLYRAKLTPWRIICSRAAVVVGCNFILNPIIYVIYYSIFYPDKTYTLYTVMLTVLKAFITFPFEAIILIVFLSAVSIPLSKMKLVPSGQTKLHVNKKLIIALIALSIVSAVMLVLVLKFGFYDVMKQLLKMLFK